MVLVSSGSFAFKRVASSTWLLGDGCYNHTVEVRSSSLFKPTRSGIEEVTHYLSRVTFLHVFCLPYVSLML